MNIHLLKAQWELFGLRAPAFSWLVSAGLIAYCASIFLRQLRESKIRQRTVSVADRRLNALRPGQLRGTEPSQRHLRAFLAGNRQGLQRSASSEDRMADHFLFHDTQDRQKRGRTFLGRRGHRGRLQRINGRGKPGLQECIRHHHGSGPSCNLSCDPCRPAGCTVGKQQDTGA